jgi:predicted nucleic acid-binding protein
LPSVTTTTSPSPAERDVRRHLGAAGVPGSRRREPRAGRRQPHADPRGITHNYVVVETAALAQRRLGGRVAQRLLEDLLPLLEVTWVDFQLHAAAVATHLRELRRRSSLVDHVSFELMRRRGLDVALTGDRDFAGAGFKLLP